MLVTWQSGYTPYTLKTKKFLRLTRVRNPVDGGGGSVGFGQTCRERRTGTGYISPIQYVGVVPNY